MLGIQNSDRRQKYITLQVVAYMIQNAWTKKMVHDMHSRYGFNIFIGLIHSLCNDLPQNSMFYDLIKYVYIMGRFDDMQ